MSKVRVACISVYRHSSKGFRKKEKIMTFINTRKSRLFKFLVGVMTFELVCYPIFPAFALPEGAQVKNGTVTFEESAGKLTVFQESGKAIVNYGSFNIGGAESVQFVQPGASSAILNRVIGGSSSTIAGSMSANGQVFLINPAGILFSSSSQINVAGLVASAMNMASEDFLEGRMKFSGGNGSVVNQGDINAGYAYLIGGQVDNSGNISAGDIVLAAGRQSVEIEKIEGGQIRLIIDGAVEGEAGEGALASEEPEEGVLIIELEDPAPEEPAAEATVRNEGTLEGTGGEVVIRSIDHVDLAEAGTISSAITETGSGKVDVFAGGNLRSQGTITATGDIFLEGTLDVGGQINGGGQLSVIGHSPVTIAIDIRATGNITITASESGVGDDLTIKPGVTIQSTSGSVFLNAGDNLILSPGSSVQAGGGDLIAIAGFTDNDGIGGAIIEGSLSALRTIDLSAIEDVAILAPQNTTGADITISGLNFDNTRGSIDTVGGTLTIDHSGTVDVNDDLISQGGDIDIDVTTGNFNVNTASIDASGGTAMGTVDVDIFNGNIDLDALSFVTSGADGDVDIRNITA
ncbi:MAG: filamentous hemagglutinin family protein, partial [Alphaproteobacteria bacterium]